MNDQPLNDRDERYIRLLVGSYQIWSSTGDDINYEKCAHCALRKVMHDVADEILRSGNFRDAIMRHTDESARRWAASKFALLVKTEREAGRDPHVAAEKLGWTL
jgi:hypothetical protein